MSGRHSPSVSKPTGDGTHNHPGITMKHCARARTQPSRQSKGPDWPFGCPNAAATGLRASARQPWSPGMGCASVQGSRGALNQGRWQR
jgi:hypothetical protein